MQTIKQKLALARWRDRKFVYHPADSHCDASEFRARMEGYRYEELERKHLGDAKKSTGIYAPIANAELVQLRGKR